MLTPRMQDDGVAVMYLDARQRTVKATIEEKIRSGRYRFETLPCALCEGSDFEPLAGKDRCGLRMHVVICTGCGLVQTNPRMTIEAYGEYYTSGEHRKLQYAGADADHTFAHERRRGAEIYEYLTTARLLPSPASSLIVDVGCGSGGTLSFFAERGARTVGFDVAPPDSHSAKAYGVELVAGTLADVTHRGLRPDVIIYAHALEHVLDLNAELQRLAEVATRSTLLYIEVPGIKNLQAYDHDLIRYLQNAHTYHFGLETLTQLMEKHGFSRVSGDEHVRSTFRRAPGSVTRNPRNDYVSTQLALQQAEASCSKPRFKRTVSRAIASAGLMDVARSVRGFVQTRRR
jgi:SAM-dependent methyltransferase